MFSHAAPCRSCRAHSSPAFRTGSRVKPVGGEETRRADWKFQTGSTGGKNTRNVNKGVFQITRSQLRNNKSRVCVDEPVEELNNEYNYHPPCHLSTQICRFELFNYSKVIDKVKRGPVNELKLNSKRNSLLFIIKSGNGATDLEFRPCNGKRKITSNQEMDSSEIKQENLRLRLDLKCLKRSNTFQKKQKKYSHDI